MMTTKHLHIDSNPADDSQINGLCLSAGRRQSADWVSVGELWSDCSSDQWCLP